MINQPFCLHLYKGREVTHTHTQAGGKPLHSPAVEITYGLERILMALQGVTNFKDIR